MTATALSTDDLALTRGHYAALRAHLQGLPAATIGGLYLGHGADSDDPVDVRRVVREIGEVRDALVQRAHQHGQPELATALARDVRGSNAATERAVDAVRRLEALGTPRPALAHAVALWFAPVLAKRLRAADLELIGDLVTCCNARGRG